MSYLKISQILADYITKDLDYDEEQKEIITYSIETISLQIFGFLLILILAYFFNAVKPAIIAAVFGAILRKFSGGAHFKSFIVCLSFGTVIYTAIGIIAKFIYVDMKVMYLMLIICFLIIFKLAPVDSPAKPIHSQSFKKKLKLASIVFLIISFGVIYIIDSMVFKTSIVLAVFYQSLTLLPIFNRN